jgi:alpha-ketoglutarate-dependent taurine dioxygenase
MLADTLWASGYELYDRLSPAYQEFFEKLSATYAQPGFEIAAKENGFELYSQPRGAPENVGSVLRAEHPVIRTNPVTGWKSIFAVGHHVQNINGLSDGESKHALEWFKTLIVENHDLQVRHKWKNANDLGEFKFCVHFRLKDHIADFFFSSHLGQSLCLSHCYLRLCWARFSSGTARC